jgi:hypothetical protein
MKRRVPLLAGGDVVVSITQVAAMMKKPRSTARDHIARLLAEDRAAGLPTDWYEQGRGRGSKARVNLTKLERRHPALFHADPVKRAEFEELFERVEIIEKVQRDEKQKTNAVIARLRDVNTRLKAVGT